MGANAPRKQHQDQEGAPDSAAALPRTVVLIGLMGAGKSCIGRHLAAKLKVPFIDADHEIEEAAGCSVADIFAIYGEPAFRDCERKVMARLLSGPPCILAAGGGAFMDATTRAEILAHGTSLWLKADLDLLVHRTQGRGHRPLLNQGNPSETLRRLIDARYPVYAECDVVVQTNDEPPERTTRRVLTALETHFGRKLSNGRRRSSAKKAAPDDAAAQEPANDKIDP